MNFFEILTWQFWNIFLVKVKWKICWGEQNKVNFCFMFNDVNCVNCQYLQTVCWSFFGSYNPIWNWKEPWPLLQKGSSLKKARLTTGCPNIFLVILIKIRKTLLTWPKLIKNCDLTRKITVKIRRFCVVWQYSTSVSREKKYKKVWNISNYKREQRLIYGNLR